MTALAIKLPRILTASALQRYAVCPGSAVLPKVETAHERTARGSVVHRFLERVAQLTGAGAALAAAREEALSEVPEEYRDACASIDLEALPLDGMRWLQEVTYAVDVFTGAARVIGCGLTREQAYGDLAPTEIGGTADVVGISADGLTIVVLDFKTGRGDVVRALVNLQVRFLALAGARAHGAINARVALTKIKDSGLSWHDEATFDALDVDLILEQLRDLHRGVVRAAVAQAEGRPLPMVTGSHCDHCSSISFCPAQTTLVRQVAGEVAEGRDDLAGQLTAATAAAAWERVKAVEAAVKRAKSAIYTFAAGHPIPLPGGLVLGPVESSREEVDGDVAVRVLEELHGPEVARRACEWSTSKAGIERALRPLAASGVGKITHLKGEALDAIRTAGGITRKTTTTVKEHVPDNRAAAQVAADMAALAASLE